MEQPFREDNEGTSSGLWISECGQVGGKHVESALGTESAVETPQIPCGGLPRKRNADSGAAEAAGDDGAHGCWSPVPGVTLEEGQT
jgi:hypothetical protein